MASAWTRQRTQGFGPTSEALDGPYQGHPHFNKGTDFGAFAGDTVEARVGGTVIAVGNQGDGWGFSVKVRDAQGNTHNYGHLDPSIPVKVGQQIQGGELVGVVGEKIEGEKSTGSHLSYDVWDSGGQFFDALAQDSSGGDGMTQPSGAASGRFYDDPADDAQYTSLKTAFITAQQAWVKAGRPAQGPQSDAYQDAMFDLQDFTDTIGHPTSKANDADPAQQAFDNRIKLGDFEQRKADSAFSKWFDRYSLAQSESTSDYNQRADHNKANIEITEARNKSMTPGLLPRATDAGYVEQSRSELMDQYLKKLNVGYEPPADVASGVQIPGQGGIPTPTTTPPANRWATEGADLMKEWEEKQKGFYIRDAPVTAPTNPWDRRRIPQESPPKGPGVTFAPLAVPAAAAKSAGSKVKKWWQRGFAEGGRNIPAQRAWGGERGPEIMEVPGFGSKIIGQDGPQEIDIPEGANIIPVDEAFAMHQIKSAVGQGNQPDIARQSMDAQARMNDPELQQKVLASLQKSMASNMIANPPYTPVLEDAALMRDYWAPERLVTGVPASQEEFAMMQQEAAKGAKK